MTIKTIIIGFIIIGILIGFIYSFNSYEEQNQNQKMSIHDFLINDQTDQHTYTENYKCMNFSIDMSKNASVNGFKSGCVAILPNNGSEGHMIVWIDTNKGRQYIEPQTDKIYNNISDFLINDYCVDINEYHTIDTSIKIASIINS